MEINRKKIIIALFFMGLALSIHAQIAHPVKWSYGERKLSTDTYEIHLKATIEDGWHVYAQKQPDNSISKPTAFKFKTEDSFKLIGKAKEIGKLVKFEDPSSGLGAYEYSNTVDFVQMVKLNKNSQSSISGTITYQACTNKMCLPPEDIPFIIYIK